MGEGEEEEEDEEDQFEFQGLRHCKQPAAKNMHQNNSVDSFDARKGQLFTSNGDSFW